MNQSIRVSFAVAILLASALPTMAGGLYIVIANPDANPRARSLGAVLTVKLAGCHEPEKAQLNAVAIGTIDGLRRSIPLQLKSLPDAGSYALMRQWPAEGRWVLQFVARDRDRVTSTLVAYGPGGVELDRAKMVMDLPNDTDVTALLSAPNRNIAKR